MLSSKTVSRTAPYCADCRGKDYWDCIICSQYPPNTMPKGVGKEIYSTVENGKEKFHYSHSGD